VYLKSSRFSCFYQRALYNLFFYLFEKIIEGTKKELLALFANNSLALNKFSFHTYSLPFFDESKKKKNQKKSLFLPKIAQFSTKI